MTTRTSIKLNGIAPRTLKEYVFEQRIREVIICTSEEEAREKLAEYYGNTRDFELLNVTTFEEAK